MVDSRSGICSNFWPVIPIRYRSVELVFTLSEFHSLSSLVPFNSLLISLADYFRLVEIGLPKFSDIAHRVN